MSTSIPENSNAASPMARLAAHWWGFSLAFLRGTERANHQNRDVLYIHLILA